MKILSFAVPCYNSEAYMRKCIDSLLPGGEDVEIIIVDDGSSDGTAAIADEYEAKYPGICRAIHQENAGHGGAVNTGITNARGMYFKVVDSDDWLDTDSYKIVLNRLKQFREDRKRVDCLSAIMSMNMWRMVHLIQSAIIRCSRKRRYSDGMRRAISEWIRIC